MKSNILTILVILIISTFSIVEARDNCAPEFDLAKPTSIIQQENTDSTDKSVFIYFDQSLSMQGFTKNQPGIKNLYVKTCEKNVSYATIIVCDQCVCHQTRKKRQKQKNKH